MSGTLIADLVAECKALIERTHRPDGYNIGFNVGEAGGQTFDALPRDPPVCRGCGESPGRGAGSCAGEVGVLKRGGWAGPVIRNRSGENPEVIFLSS